MVPVLHGTGVPRVKADPLVESGEPYDSGTFRTTPCHDLSHSATLRTGRTPSAATGPALTTRPADDQSPQGPELINPLRISTATPSTHLDEEKLMMHSINGYFFQRCSSFMTPRVTERW
jgi:hypothetical protein